MIGSLRGPVTDRTGTELLVEVGGVGYRIQTTPASAVALSETGGEQFVWIHHHLREDVQTLYGFEARDERDVFEVLIGTHGVGPSLALAILSVHSPRALRLALATDDVAALCLVPGVGRKTAARLLVELKSRLDLGSIDLTGPHGAVGTADGAPPSSPHADVRDALAGLGYANDEIAAVVRDLPGEGESADLLRMALQRLAVA